MRTTGNTILFTGGRSGIGRALAEAFHALGNQVIISGRTKKSLDEVTAANPGMKSLTVDATDPASLRAFAAKVLADFRAVNVLVNNAGVMRPEDVKAQPADVPDAEATIATNLLGSIRLTAALLPHLLKQPSAAVMNVTSGLAFVPYASFPTYCATKAALHSYTESLRYQLRGTSVEVLELAPPYVRTGLTSDKQANDPRAMPLADFIAEVMSILKTEPTPPEILVGKVQPLRYSGLSGPEKYGQFFVGLNEAMAAERH